MEDREPGRAVAIDPGRVIDDQVVGRPASFAAADAHSLWSILKWTALEAMKVDENLTRDGRRGRTDAASCRRKISWPGVAALPAEVHDPAWWSVSCRARAIDPVVRDLPFVETRSSSVAGLKHSNAWVLRSCCLSSVAS